MRIVIQLLQVRMIRGWGIVYSDFGLREGNIRIPQRNFSFVDPNLLTTSFVFIVLLNLFFTVLHSKINRRLAKVGFPTSFHSQAEKALTYSLS